MLSMLNFQTQFAMFLGDTQSLDPTTDSDKTKISRDKGMWRENWQGLHLSLKGIVLVMISAKETLCDVYTTCQECHDCK